MNKDLRTRDEIALEKLELTLKKARQAVKESEKEGLVIYVDFKAKKVTGYGKI